MSEPNDDNKKNSFLANRMNKKLKKFNSKETRQLAWASSIGLSMVFATFLGFIFGWYIDKYFNSSPYGVIIGAIIGIGAGFNNLFMMVKKMDNEDKKEQGIKKYGSNNKSK